MGVFEFEAGKRLPKRQSEPNPAKLPDWAQAPQKLGKGLYAVSRWISVLVVDDDEIVRNVLKSSKINGENINIEQGFDKAG